MKVSLQKADCKPLSLQKVNLTEAETIRLDSVGLEAIGCPGPACNKPRLDITRLEAGLWNENGIANHSAEGSAEKLAIHSDELRSARNSFGRARHLACKPLAVPGLAWNLNSAWFRTTRLGLAWKPLGCTRFGF